MKILGIRNYSDGIRYAIIEKDDSGYKCLNLSNENRITKPKSCEGNDIYTWFRKEIERIIDNNKGFDGIAIKQNENTPSNYSKLKQVMFFDCITTMVASDKNIPISSFVYTNLRTSSKNVEQLAESNVGKTSKHWDTKIADAIVAAIKMTNAHV
ncbi:MAG: hypothetical protein PHD21_00360 [Flavobacteriales bacterium]|nr:hypothetical protein [Flavobacteriales bacterium]